MASALALLAPPCFAQIVVDSTLGSPGALTGPAFVIPDTLGTQVGSNLFHSFSDFNIRAGESATFTSSFSNSTTNVISRVTGPQASIIDGALRSEVAGADLWFINPHGLVIGPTATLSVLASFYAGGAESCCYRMAADSSPRTQAAPALRSVRRPRLVFSMGHRAP